MSWFLDDHEPEPEPEPAPEPGFFSGSGWGAGSGSGNYGGTAMTTHFRGLGVALVTPFKTDGALDEAAFELFIDFHIDEGTNFLVPCGTTGENPALTQE